MNYAKFLKQEYNVIAIAVSGTNMDNMKVDIYYWKKGTPLGDTSEHTIPNGAISQYISSLYNLDLLS